MSRVIQNYIDLKNREASIWEKNPTIINRVANLTRKDVEALLNRIEGELSPENISCDGEADPRWVRQEYQRLTRVQAELQRLLAKFKLHPLQ